MHYSTTLVMHAESAGITLVMHAESAGITLVMHAESAGITLVMHAETRNLETWQMPTPKSIAVDNLNRQALEDSCFFKQMDWYFVDVPVWHTR